MKLLAFVDIHGNKAALNRIISRAKKEKPDVVVSAGDLSVFSQKLDRIVSELNSLDIPVLFVHGNHESASGMKTVCSLFKNTHFIHDSSFVFDDFVFIGYGGSGFTVVDDEFVKVAKRLKTQLSRGKQIVFVSHAPPHNTKLDALNGEHHGNKSISEFIYDVKPVLVICGHFHENSGMKDKVGGTVVVNPGPAGAVIEI